MTLNNEVVFCAILLCFHIVASVKVKVVMRSEENSRGNDDEVSPRTEAYMHKKKSDISLPFLKHPNKIQSDTKQVEFEEVFTTEKQVVNDNHPNEMIFPLIYKQKNINSMFKYGETWYTWAIEKRTDGSTAINYYTCIDEPKRCDDIGWDSVDTLPKCAFQIEALLPDDRACINTFGVEPHSTVCDGAEQMKVSDMVHSCGPRIRSFWRFNRVGKRPTNVPKPADVNSLFCEDEEECFLTIEYRIHHDRITCSLHEPTRGQTYKSVLKREISNDEEKLSPSTEVVTKRSNRKRKENGRHKKIVHSKVKESNYIPTYTAKQAHNLVKNRDDISEDLSE